MSTKTICDGCGGEIKPWDPKDPSASDGLKRELRLSTGNNYQVWDLCDPCQGRVATALAELLPKTPRDVWFDAIRPTKHAYPVNTQSRHVMNDKPVCNCTPEGDVARERPPTLHQEHCAILKWRNKNNAPTAKHATKRA